MKNKRRELGWDESGVCTMCGHIVSCRCYHPERPKETDASIVRERLYTVLTRHHQKTIPEICLRLWASTQAVSDAIASEVAAGRVAYKELNNAGWTLPAFVLAR